MARRYAILLALAALAGPSVVQGETGSVAPAPPTITSAPPAVTNSDDAQFEFSHSDLAVIFDCSLDGTPFFLCTSPQLYTSLAEGAHSFQVRAVDLLGPGDPAAHTWTIDLTPPVVVLSSPAAGSVTNDSTPTFSGTAGTATGDAGAVTVVIRVGTEASGKPHSAFSAPVNPATGVWAGQPAALADGTYTARAEQSDAAGNKDESAPRTFTIDTTPPAVAVSSPPNGSATNDTTPTFSGTAGTATGDAGEVTLLLWSGTTTTGSPDATVTASVDSATGQWTTGLPSPLSSGTYSARARQVDAAGNTGVSAKSTFEVDFSVPAVTIATPATGTVTSQRQPTFSGTADPGTVTIKIFNGALATGSPAETMTALVAGGAWSASPDDPLADGTHTVLAQETNALGTTGSSAAVLFIVDATAPTFMTFPGHQTLEQTSAAGELLSYSVTATDALDPEPDVSCSPSPGAVVPLGTTTITCTVTDWAGNTAAAGFSVTVQNTLPPAAVLGFSARGGDERVRLAWQRPADFDYRRVVIQRTPRNRTDWTTILETSDATRYTDRRVRNNREYTYRIVSRDAFGHASAHVMQNARPSAFFSPLWNAVVTSPPTLRWSPVRNASYYNIQVWRNGRKILSRWPARARYAMDRSWLSLGQRFRLTSGTYYGFVWAGFGPRAAADFGRIVGWTRFVVR